MLKIHRELFPLFNRQDFTFMDLSDAKSFGSIDEESVDGMHCSEKAYLRVLIELAKQSLPLKQLVDIKSLSGILAKAKSNYEVFE